MVSYFDESFGARVNPYANLSLAEACCVAESNISEMASDLQMSILMNEHAFLLENGREIEYMSLAEEAEAVDQAKKEGILDKMGSTVSGIKNKVIKFIKTTIATIMDMLDRFMSWVGMKITELTSKLGVSEKKLVENYEKVTDAQREKWISAHIKFVPKTAHGDSIFNIINSSMYVRKLADCDPNKIYKSEDVFDNLMDKMDGSAKQTSKAANIYGISTIKDALFGHKGFAKKVAENKKEISKALNDEIKAVKATAEDNVADSIDKYTAALKNNTAVSHGYIKAWTAFTNACASLARFYATQKVANAANDKLENLKGRAEAAKKALQK